MINLLPPEQKRFLRKEYFFRLTVFGGVALLGALVVFAILLFSLQTYIASNAQIKQIAFTSLRLSTTKQEKTVRQNIIANNNTIANMQHFYAAETRVSVAFKRIAKLLCVNCNISALTYTAIPPKKGTTKPKALIVFSGYAATRDDLLLFQKNLQQDSFFLTVSFPASDWIQKSKVQFSGKVTVLRSPKTN